MWWSGSQPTITLERATIVSVKSYKITHCLRIDETTRIAHAQRTFSGQAMTGMVLRKRPEGLKGVPYHLLHVHLQGYTHMCSLTQRAGLLNGYSQLG